MIQLSLSFQSTRTQHEMAQASMNAKGFASNRFVKESVVPVKDNIAFGGPEHSDGRRKGGSQLSGDDRDDHPKFVSNHPTITCQSRGLKRNRNLICQSIVF